ncbi:BON domain-containing protein [Chitinophaga sp. SYP-B3965]|uniref:BON domain-containing protein n=1 Tax=Chitinophaga sp. SYP-B3965 TaxID=2663120 RepID=UPI001299F8D3|nr:BON domain-containing protein [Chitinophaga sp. SYP-B3965]MRG45326.1 BON domain-containing protein [Chitinophaga sp. SYP-B3965]
METDLQIQKNVMDELQWDPVLNASEIAVTVKDGIVTLSGFVNSYSRKLAAENAAKRIKNVRAVAIDLEVKMPDDEKRTDADIAAAVLEAFKWNSFVPEDAMKVSVEDGWVTIEGEVEWQFQRESVSSAIKNLVGVHGIRNLLKVKPKVTAIIIKDVVKKALERSAAIEATGVDTLIEGGRIVLKGKVRSWAEWREVEKAVWATPGVLEVKNDLIVAS